MLTLLGPATSRRHCDGVLRRDFLAIAFLSDSPALKLLRFAHERAALPGAGTIEDRASLTPQFWKLRARHVLAQTHSDGGTN